jgi:hypothetical protein
MTPAKNAARAPRARGARRAAADARANGTVSPARAKSAAARSKSATRPPVKRQSRGSRGTSDNGTLTLELSRAQVQQVVRAASGSQSISASLSAMLESPERLARTLAGFDDTRLSRSLLWGLLVFAAFPADGESLGNLEVARMLGMNPSTAHRYISTFLEVGLLERDAWTRRYRLAR